MEQLLFRSIRRQNLMEMPKLHQEKVHGLFTHFIFVLAFCLALTSVFYSISLEKYPEMFPGIAIRQLKS